MMKLMQGFFLSVVLLSSAAAQAETVTLNLPNHLVARAEFRQGDPEKPAVILLHGFLQTHTFPTISLLTDSLADEGYTVLAPTLTLGITHRSQSMACEAINNHTVADGVAELKLWTKWLQARKARKIVLGGHSLGNVYNLAYASGLSDGSLHKLIGISIVEGRLKVGERFRKGMVSKLRDKVRNGDRDMQEEQFSFCQKFRSTPGSLLSYMEWGPDRILAAVNKTKIPITMIMGSKDDRLGKDWVERLKKTRAKVIVIEEANHFMDGQYEFDLVDHFLAELKGL